MDNFKSKNKLIALKYLRAVLLISSRNNDYTSMAAGLALCGFMEFYYKDYNDSYEFFTQLVFY